MRARRSARRCIKLGRWVSGGHACEAISYAVEVQSDRRNCRPPERRRFASGYKLHAAGKLPPRVFCIREYRFNSITSLRSSPSLVSSRVLERTGRRTDTFTRTIYRSACNPSDAGQLEENSNSSMKNNIRTKT